MTLISRYVLRQFVIYFAMILIVVLGLYTMIDFIEKIDDFIEARLPIMLACRYFTLNMPFVFSQITPLATLLSVLITFGLMGKHNELIALKSSGVSLMALVKPVLGFALGCIGLIFVMAEVVSPLTVSQANVIWTQKVRGHAAAVTHQNDIWLKGQQSIVHLKFYNVDTHTAQGVTIHRFDRQFRLEQRIDAQSAVWRQPDWVLGQGMIQYREPQTGHFKTELFDQRVVSLGFVPDDLARAAPQTQTMNFLQLDDYIKKLENDGYDASRYRVDFHAKIAFPFVCLLLALIGLGLAGGGRLKEGLPLNISLGIGIAFLYWISFSFCISLGYAGMLSPFLAAWTVNLIGFCIAVVLIVNAEQ